MKRQVVLTWRQAAALAATVVVAMLLTIAGAWFLTRQPTDELRNKQARIHRLTTGLGDCALDPACRRSFRRLERGARQP